MALIDRWQKRPWRPDELRELAEHLTAAATAAEEMAEGSEQLADAVDRLAGLLGRHARAADAPTGAARLERPAELDAADQAAEPRD